MSQLPTWAVITGDSEHEQSCGIALSVCLTKCGPWGGKGVTTNSRGPFLERKATAGKHQNGEKLRVEDEKQLPGAERQDERHGGRASSGAEGTKGR